MPSKRLECLVYATRSKNGGNGREADGSLATEPGRFQAETKKNRHPSATILRPALPQEGHSELRFGFPKRISHRSS